MPFKWNDTTERMMLIKFVEQNLSDKLNVDAALAKWQLIRLFGKAKGMEIPTKRSIGDRFNLLKKQIREARVAVSLGQGAISVTSTPQSVPRTPKPLSNGLRGLGNGSTKPKKFTATTIDGDSIDTDAEDENPKTSTSKSRGKTTPANNRRSTKRKRKDSDDDESPSADAEAESDSDGTIDRSETPAGHHPRQSLPRRSKSNTPAVIPSINAEDESEDDDNSNDDDSNSSFDPTNNRSSHRHQKTQRQLWQKKSGVESPKIAMMEYDIKVEDDDENNDGDIRE